MWATGVISWDSTRLEAEGDEGLGVARSHLTSKMQASKQAGRQVGRQAGKQAVKQAGKQAPPF